MVFRVQQPVLFRHCDPAGIIFYPRYFEMLNDTVEAFFATIPGYSFAEMHPDNGVPTAQISTEFHAPSRQGDVLDITLSLTKLGTSSATTHTHITCNGEARLTATSVLVHVGASKRSAPWPTHVRAALETLLTGDP